MRRGTAAWLFERDQQRITLRVPAEIHDALTTLSRATGDSINSLVCQAIHDHLVANGRWEKVERWLERTGERYRAGLDLLGEGGAPAEGG